MSPSNRLSFFVLLLSVSLAATAGDGTAEGGANGGSGSEPAPGSLVIPGQEKQQAAGEDKKCMTVCARWGKECTYINRGAGGTTRKCRRTCQQFTEECF